MEAAKIDPEIAEALSLESKFWADERERELYYVEQRRLLDELSNEQAFQYLLKEAEEKKKEEVSRAALQAEIKGRSEGEHSKAVATARKLLKMGLTVDNTAEATGLSESEVRKLLD